MLPAFSTITLTRWGSRTSCTNIYFSFNLNLFSIISNRVSNIFCTSCRSIYIRSRDSGIFRDIFFIISNCDSIFSIKSSSLFYTNCTCRSFKSRASIFNSRFNLNSVRLICFENTISSFNNKCIIPTSSSSILIICILCPTKTSQITIAIFQIYLIS